MHGSSLTDFDIMMKQHKALSGHWIWLTSLTAFPQGEEWCSLTAAVSSEHASFLISKQFEIQGTFVLCFGV